MDRNTIIGLVLIMGLIITYMVFFNEPPKKPQNQNSSNSALVESTDSASVTDDNTGSIADAVEQELPDSTLSDSVSQNLKMKRLRNQFGGLAASAEGEEKEIRVRTDRVDVTFSTKGARFKEFILSEYETYDSLPLPLIMIHPENTFSMGFSMLTDDGKPVPINTDELYFKFLGSDDDIVLQENDSTVVRFQATAGDGRYVEFAYTIRYGDYNIGFDSKFEGIVTKNRTREIRWVNHMPQTEKSLKTLRQKSGIYYRIGDDVEDFEIASEDPQHEKESNVDVDWVAMNGQFFTQTLMADPDHKFSYFDLTSSVPGTDKYSEKLEIKIGVDENSGQLNFFMSPLKLSLLKDYGRGMTEQMNLGYLGILPAINKYFLYPTFRFFEGFISNYGIIVLLLAILVKLLVAPLTFKSYISSAKMRVINTIPEIKALDEKYKDDATKLQQEKMSIYKQFGVSPFGGCLPMVLQMPFLFSMFFFFPAVIELRQQPFLWATDLSSYDTIYNFPDGFSIPFYGDHISLFTLLMAVSLFAFTIINQKTQPAMANNPAMKILPYITPIFLLGFMNNYAAGLSWYYLIVNVISILQTTVTKFMIDDQKILDEAQEFAKKKKKTGKKGRMERWMEDTKKKQRAIQKDRSKNKKR